MIDTVNPYLTILLPVYNEEHSIRPVIEGIFEELARSAYSFEILVVDDGSTDQTARQLEKIDSLRLVAHARNRGYGAGVRTGIRQARGEKILLMDADRTYPASVILKMADLAQHHAMVVGARRGPGGVGQSQVRRALRWIFKASASLLMGKWIPDLNSGMRVIDTALARRYAEILPDGFSASSTLTVLFMRNGHSIAYMDIPYGSRTGISKLNVLLDGLRFFRFLIRSLKERR